MVASRSEEHTSELQSRSDLVCRLLLEKKKRTMSQSSTHEHESPKHKDRRPDQRERYEHQAHPEQRDRDEHQAHPVQFFFFNDPATTEIYTLSLHDALPICGIQSRGSVLSNTVRLRTCKPACSWRSEEHTSELQSRSDLVCRLLLEKKK